MKIFHFKQFSVKQEKSAMKISTDSVLLGAWTPVENPQNILDIGAGTGILSLMLAQRTKQSLIRAVEVEPEAFQECCYNFEKSIWKIRLKAYLSDIERYTKEDKNKYDLIISNPPYFTETMFSEQYQRNLARFTQSLPFEELLSCVANLLSETGLFSVIIPYNKEHKFTDLAKKHNLFLQKITHVRGNIHSEIKRSLLLFSFTESSDISTSELVIEKQRHVYTDEYIELTKDFYLNLKK